MRHYIYENGKRKYTEYGKKVLSNHRRGIPRKWKWTKQASLNLSKALKGRKLSEETKRKLSLAKKDKPNLSAIGNKNWLGKHHLESSKRKVALSKIGIPRSIETRRKVSLGLIRGIKEGRIKIHNTKRIRYKGILFRSNWEILFAKTLDRFDILWKYEELLLIPSGGYLVDFFLSELGFYVEIKGYWRDDALRKYLEAVKIYPLILIMEKEMKDFGIIGDPLDKENFLDRLGGELVRNAEKEQVCS